jgi:hypothetical protein
MKAFAIAEKQARTESMSALAMLRQPYLWIDSSLPTNQELSRRLRRYVAPSLKRSYRALVR